MVSTNRNKHIYSKAFQERRETNGFAPQKSWVEEEQTEVFQSFSETKKNERMCSKKFQIEEDQTAVNQRFSGTKRNKRLCSKKIRIEAKTNCFDSDWEEKKSNKNESSSFFGTKAKSKWFDLKKNEVLTLLLLQYWYDKNSNTLYILLNCSWSAVDIISCDGLKDSMMVVATF